jgi:hypothetical protein
LLFLPELAPLLGAVVEIEQGRRAGTWVMDRGRLWVISI